MEQDLGPLVSSLVNDGIFGAVKFVGLEPDDTVKGAQFASALAFINLTVEGISAKEVFPLVVKLPFNDPNMRVARNSDAMFHNEVTMYKEILPGLGVDVQMYPKMFYGVATNGVDPESDLIVLENLKYKNLVLSKTKLFLDIDHISVAIKQIAVFHSYSYRLKHENSEKFLEITKRLKKVSLPKPIENDFGAINAAAIKRGIKPLLKNNINVELLNKCLTLLRYPFKAINLISFPEEPFAVICHGDFCNNNILYKFDESDRPVDCVIFDFQLSQYGSPAIDLFFFLYMHTNSESREKYWDEILKLYWDTLKKNVPNNIGIPDFKDFLNHFSKRAIYGYIISSFFLPAVIVKTPAKLDEIFKLPLEEKITRLLSQGGDEGEHAISEIVLHLVHKGYISSFIELCEEKNYGQEFS